MSKDLRTPEDPLQALADALRQGATTAPTWFLTHQERWRWLVETLMGHPRIRGGQRPRDYPGDSFGRDLLAQVVELHGRPLQPWGKLPENTTCRFGSWLFAFVLIVETQVLARCCKKCPCPGAEPGACCPDPGAALARALDWVVWQTLRALERAEDEAAYHLVLSTLGVAPVEAPSLKGRKSDGERMEPQGPGRRLNIPAECGEDLRVAASAAYYAGAHHAGVEVGGKWPVPIPMERAQPEIRKAGKRAGAPPQGQVAPSIADRDKVVGFLDGQVWTLFLKAAHVQKFLGRAKVLWMARGASAWVSQVVAAARDRLPMQKALRNGEQSLGPLLLTDVGAFSFHACAVRPDCRELLSGLVKDLSNHLGQWNPKLAAFLRSHPELPQDSRSIRSCFPELCIEASPASIRSLCAPGMPWNAGIWEAEREAKAQEGLRWTWAPSNPTRNGPPCGFVTKPLRQKAKRVTKNPKTSPALDDAGLLGVDEVPWRKGDEEKSMIGWSGMAWSLAGATYKAHTLQGFAGILGLSGIRHHDIHAEWLKGMNLNKPEIAYLFLDGDHVGKAFAAMAPIQGFQTALELLKHTQLGLLEGMKAACTLAQDNGPVTTLPVELIYLGGDDLVCTLPTSLLPGFLERFSTHAKWASDSSYTGVIIRVPHLGMESSDSEHEPSEKLKENKKKRKEIIKRREPLLVNLLFRSLKMVKKTTRNEPSEETLGDLQAHALLSDFLFEPSQLDLAEESGNTFRAFSLHPIPAALEAAP